MFDKQYRAILQAKNQHDAIGTTFDLWRFTSKKTNKEYVVLMEKYHDNMLLRKSEVDSGNIGFDGCVEFIDTIS